MTSQRSSEIRGILRAIGDTAGQVYPGSPERQPNQLHHAKPAHQGGAFAQMNMPSSVDRTEPRPEKAIRRPGLWTIDTFKC
jgi:hypothetical protein